jgi:hypothetical protein
MERSDQILQNAFLKEGGLSKSERGELREAYLWEQEQKKGVSVKTGKNQVLGKENMMNLPRHKVHTYCSDFQECPICYKCRSYDPAYEKCRNCVLTQEKLHCNKQLHSEPVLEMMIRRECIEIKE